MEAIWATLLAKALEEKNVKEVLSNGGAPATGSGPAVPSAGGDGPVADEKKDKEKEEKDEDMVRLTSRYNLED